MDGNDIVMEGANTIWWNLKFKRKNKIMGNNQDASTFAPKHNSIGSKITFQ